MKRTPKILISIFFAAVIITVTVFVVFNSQEATAGLPDGEPPQWQVLVSGNVEQEKTFSLKEITEMPLTTVVTKVNGKNVTYKGVTLFEFCNRTGMLWDSGPINVIANEEKKATINIYQAWNSTEYPYYQESNRITLVFAEDDQWMTKETGGPVKLIAPYFPEECQIEGVSEVNLDMWTVSISGAVDNPITICSKNMTVIQKETIEAEFVPGDGQRTSNWTGLSIMDILDVANASYRATKIGVFAIDDYSRNYTRNEIIQSNMFLAYQENGVPLPQSSGGPYRLCLPIDKYKWAQFWVKFVKQIVVYD
jgi:DMSO/TMAO reductase YedYZ molybdopterin-dependent catalytic subunit